MRTATRMVVLNSKKYVLDLISAVVAVAYSLRRLYTSYTGAAIKVRRSSDNAERDIGFIGEHLDVFALLAFVGAGNGFVKIWYDQSGNGRNATQPTPANQPQIVASGAVITEGGQPAIRFDGVNDYLAAASPLIGTTHSLFFVSTPTIENQTGTVFGQWSAGQTGRFLFNVNQNSLGITEAGKLNPFNSTATAGGGGGFAADVSISNTPTLITSISTTGSEQWKLFKNGAQWDSATITSVFTGVNSAIGSSNATGSLNPFDGAVSELLLFPSVLSTTDRQTLERNQGIYFNISVS
jgi:trimeric autotransporter adhesin